MQRLIFSSCLLLAVCSLTAQSATIIQQYPATWVRCVPPLRTMPGLNEYHGRRGRRSYRALSDWCPPGTEMQFPQTATPQWRRERTRPPQEQNPSVNPYWGTAVEGGSAGIIFPGQEHLNGQHHPFGNSVQDAPFINGKMHPSLNRPTTSVVRLEPVGTSVQDAPFINGKMHPSLHRPTTSVDRLEPVGTSVEDAPFINGKMHPSLNRPTTSVDRLEPVGTSVHDAPFINGKMHPSLYRPTTSVDRLEPVWNSVQDDSFVNGKMHPSLLGPSTTVVRLEPVHRSTN